MDARIPCFVKSNLYIEIWYEFQRKLFMIQICLVCCFTFCIKREKSLAKHFAIPPSALHTTRLQSMFRTETLKSTKNNKQAHINSYHTDKFAYFLNFFWGGGWVDVM